MNDKIANFLTVAVLVGIVTMLFIAPIFERDAYNRLCHGSATYTDALFSELRVDGACR